MTTVARAWHATSLSHRCAPRAFEAYATFYEHRSPRLCLRFIGSTISLFGSFASQWHCTMSAQNAEQIGRWAARNSLNAVTEAEDGFAICSLADETHTRDHRELLSRLGRQNIHSTACIASGLMSLVVTWEWHWLISRWLEHWTSYTHQVFEWNRNQTIRENNVCCRKSIGTARDLLERSR